MRLEIVWRQDQPHPGVVRRPTVLHVQSAWPSGSWICYRKHGSPETTHMIPESAVDEVLITEEPSDPDVMCKRTPPPTLATLDELAG